MIQFVHTFRRHALALLLLGLSIVAYSQSVYQQGVRKGVVKVKFTSSLTETLSAMKVSARSSGLTTGMQTFDAVAKTTQSKNMYRLFPYDARFEHKLRKHGLHLWYVVETDESMDPKAVAAQYDRLGEVEVAEVEYEKVLAPYATTPYSAGASTLSTPPFNDPLLKDQWHYNNTGQVSDGDADVNLYAAWQVTTGSADVIVSVHDEGVDIRHEDIKENLWVNVAEKNGTPGVDDDNNGYVDDIHGYNFAKRKGEPDAQYHGTHVAGTVAAVTNNGVGVAGVAGGSGSGNGAKIMSLQIFGGSAQIEKTYVYAANNGAVISQNSWGYTSPYYFEQSILDAIDYFIEEAGDYSGSPMRGGVVIFAAGNSDADGEWYPGYYPNTLAVGSLGPDWKKAWYSNYGTWVDVSAPGGDQDPPYGGKGGVLSTIPSNKYAYMQGTSMACPHVSGIAALALANRTRQLTNEELLNKLITGVVNIDEFIPNYLGKLGSGAIDAYRAIQNDQGKAPVKIDDLALSGISQEFALLNWTVPADEDDGSPLSFQLYYHTSPITPATLASASKIELKNNLEAGEGFTYEVPELLGLTTYYFMITSTDRWGNVSVYSNDLNATTNAGPSIAVDENSQEIFLEIDVAAASAAQHPITILNNAEGVLRWEFTARHKDSALPFSTTSLNYPAAKKPSGQWQVQRRDALKPSSSGTAKPVSATPFAFEPVVYSYTGYPTNIIGETDLTLTNSSAAKFLVTQPEGFNLTNARMYIKHDPAKGPVIMEVYEGSAPVKSNLVFAQEYSHWSASEGWASITLNEQLYFPAGSTFWLAFHVPAGNLFPLGIGFEEKPEYSSYCYMSFDVGATWAPLEEVLASDDFAWSIEASSYNEHLGNYITLEPSAGEVEGNSSAETLMTANGATLVNGSYAASAILQSNDAQQRELRIPVNLTVAGHRPVIKYPTIVNFGAVFMGTEKTMDVVISNEGYGNYDNPEFSISGSEFEIKGYAPWKIKAREEEVIQVTFKPTQPGNSNDVLFVTNGVDTYEIPLFGVGTETATINVSPAYQLLDNVTIGDEVTAQVTVENNGAYPLEYFIPGFDSKGISDDWPSDYPKYGYKIRTNYGDEPNPVNYEFQDISTTGVDITSSLNSDDKYYTLDMGFEFPYYEDVVTTLYIAQKGFTTFDNSVRPINTPQFPGNQWTPKGVISILGAHFNYITQGKIHYQLEPDRVIVQYTDVWDGYSVGESITAQMVLYANGDIRFFYENMGYSSFNSQYLIIGMEDLAQTDAIVLSNWENPTELYSGLALGFDYPGPNIITSVENGSGVLSPGASISVDITMNTSTLSEGLVNRYVNIISNDPENSQSNVLIQLNITDGGTPQPEVSLDTLAFGDVFQGAVKSVPFTVKNPGTAEVDITSMTWVNDAFILTGTEPITIKPGLYSVYSIAIPTDATTSPMEDWLSINYADGSHDTIYVTGRVVDPPAINADLSALQHTLAFGETASFPYTIENTGLANLEVSVAGNQWLTFNSATATSDNGYMVEKHSDGNFYQWIDIRKTGTQLPFMTFEDFEGTFWRELDLPFPMVYYGVEYTSMKIGDNGIISFEDAPEASLFTDFIPSQSHAGPCIMPYWTFSGFSDYLYPIEDIGIFYQFYDDKFIITWSYFTNNFGGMGDPVSAQFIYYKNGTMKFQYKREEGGTDLTSHFGTIGFQKDSETGVAISEYQMLDHGSGLAYIITPANNYVIAPGNTLTGNIELDAAHVYGGVYSSSLKIQTNVPGSETLEKPVEMTVTGDAVLVAEETVDFGEKMIVLDFGWPITYTIDNNFGNTGAAPLEITWAQMADGTKGLSLQIWAYVDGWFGKEWRWADISELYSPWAWETPVFKVLPNDMLQVRAAFAPSVGGTVEDEVVLTTNLGEIRLLLKGIGVDPPALTIDTTPIDVVMNTLSETSQHTIAFDNSLGLSVLNYEVSIDYGRPAPSARTEAMGTQAGATDVRSAGRAKVNPVARPYNTYNRTISHTASTTPDTFIGTGGAAPFTLATQFNAGPEGFNLSHVETWFRAETLTSVTVEAEVRVGGTSIADATTIAQGTLTLTGSGNDETGDWHAIAMESAGRIFPNEDFYIIVTYPFGIEFPQGTITSSLSVPNRYLYYDEGEWSDLQTVPSPGFATMGWLMYAAEQTAASGSWINITSATEGQLAIGEASSIEVLIDGANAERGDQLAHVVLTSNDPYNEEVRIPVTLHMNEAPHFTGDIDAVVMDEGESLTLRIYVTDTEGNNFTLAADQTYADAEHTYADGLLTVTLTPENGDDGNFTYTYRATDEFNAIGELKLEVEVRNANLPPEYVGEEVLTYYASGALIEYALTDLYEDPDGDAMTYEVTTSDKQVVTVFKSDDKLLIQPLAVGEAELHFTVRDALGAKLEHSVPVVVNLVLGLDEEQNRGFKVYPNPATESTTVEVSTEWKGLVTMELVDATGRRYKSLELDADTQRSTVLNVSTLPRGLYVLKAVSSNRSATYKLIKK